MSAADRAQPVSLVEARGLFASFADGKTVVIAVSGGPDSTALLWLAARWRASRKDGPAILAVTVDHGLRAESAREASAVKRLATRLGVAHRTMRWRGAKPKAGLQAAARAARYTLLAAAARKAGARHIMTAHTLDDQAETVLLRLLRGSGPAGLTAMALSSPCPADPALVLVRPLLSIPKLRLIATLEAAGIGFVDDPGNRDPRHTRVRLRRLMPRLADEGLTASRLALFGQRLRRADEALRAAVATASNNVSLTPWGEGTQIVFDRGRFLALPAEIGLRLLGQAIAHVGDEGPVKLGKLEALFEDLVRPDRKPGRRTLAGAMVSLMGTELVIERAPPRRRPPGRAPHRRISALTTRKAQPAERPGHR